MSLRDDRAATLIFSAASTPVSYLCAGMIGIHYRPPPAARLAPQGGICKLSPSLNGIRLSAGAETGAATNPGSPSASSSAPLVLTGICGAGQCLQGRDSSCPPSPPMGVSRHGQELPGQGQTLQVRIGRRRLMLKMLGLSTSNLPLNFGQASLPWCSTPSMVTHINLALLLPQKAARAPQHQGCRSSVPRPCSRWSRSCARKGDVPRTAGNPQAAPVTAQNAQNSTSEACNTTRSLGEGAASCSRRQTPPAAPWGHRAQRGPRGARGIAAPGALQSLVGSPSARHPPSVRAKQLPGFVLSTAVFATIFSSPYGCWIPSQSCQTNPEKNMFDCIKVQTSTCLCPQAEAL